MQLDQLDAGLRITQGFDDPFLGILAVDQHSKVSATETGVGEGVLDKGIIVGGENDVKVALPGQLGQGVIASRRPLPFDVLLDNGVSLALAEAIQDVVKLSHFVIP